MPNMENNTYVSTYSNSYTEIENDSLVLIFCVIFFSTLYIIFDLVVIVALRKTKTVPSMAKFLAMSLLLCYAIIAIIVVCRRAVGNYNHAIMNLTLIGSAFRITNYTTTAMLALDRFVVIQYPFFYCRNIHSGKFKSVAVVSWCIVFAWYVAGLMWKCNLTASNGAFITPTCFRQMTPPFAGPVFGTTAVVICVCFFIISKALYKQSKDKHMTIFIGMYKTTIAILANILNFMTVLVFYILTALSLDLVENVPFIFEVLTGLNALVDTVIYALWFKECRLELFKMATICIPKLGQEVERLRFQVFNIPTAENEAYGRRA